MSGSWLPIILGITVPVLLLFSFSIVTYYRAQHRQTGMLRRTRLLGMYLLLCVVYQTGLYYRPDLLPKSRTVTVFFNTSWFYFANPRIGILFLLNDSSARVAYLVSAAWLFIVAAAMSAVPKKRISLWFYIAVEFVISAPAVLYILGALLLRSSMGTYSVDTDFELQTEAAVLFAFSIVPCAFAIWILLQSDLSRQSAQSHAVGSANHGKTG